MAIKSKAYASLMTCKKPTESELSTSTPHSVHNILVCVQVSQLWRLNALKHLDLTNNPLSTESSFATCGYAACLTRLLLANCGIARLSLLNLKTCTGKRYHGTELLCFKDTVHLSSFASCITVTVVDAWCCRHIWNYSGPTPSYLEGLAWQICVIGSIH